MKTWIKILIIIIIVYVVGELIYDLYVAKKRKEAGLNINPYTKTSQVFSNSSLDTFNSLNIQKK